jgi:serine/threonine protein kinase
LLADFGLTKHTASPGRPTATGQMVGMVDYVAPEQIRGDRSTGARISTRWGCVLFESLTGELPFARRSEVSTIYAHLEEDPPRAGERRPCMPAALDDVIARALAKQPSRRFQTAAELATAARAAMAEGRTATVRPLRGGDTGASNLPRPPTRLVGRDREVA